jgi:hypothetical protein
MKEERFTVVVHEVNANGGVNTTYTLNVSSAGFTRDPAPAFAQVTCFNICC